MARGDGAIVHGEVWQPYFNRSPEHFSSHAQTPVDRPTGYPVAVVSQDGAAAYIYAAAFRGYREDAFYVYKEIIGRLLARLLPGEPVVAARFEAYVGGIELCNGFHELGSAAEQRRRFDHDLEARAARGLPAMPIDERLLAALAAGLPDSAGVAVGFDRIVMLAAGLNSIDEVLSFTVDGA